MCSCKDQVNEHLAGKNARLEEISLVNLLTGRVRNTIVLKTERADRTIKKLTKSVVPTYCPFCGVLYNEDAAS